MRWRFARRAEAVPAPGSDAHLIAGHAFLSYVREDAAAARRLQRKLEAAGIRVWLDTADIWPGDDWRAGIRRAITGDALAFIACFSRKSLSRASSYQNEELNLAIEQLRLRQPDAPWLIPVRFDDCEIPDLDIGRGRTLATIQRVDLFGAGYAENAARLIEAIQRILGSPAGTPAPRRSRRRLAVIAGAWTACVIILAGLVFEAVTAGNSATSRYTFTIHPARWPPDPVPGLTLARGDSVWITALRGQWRCASFEPFTGIQGNPQHTSSRRSWAVPAAPFCSLIGKVGDGPWQEMRRHFVVSGAGKFVLTANDTLPRNCPQPPSSTSCYNDNKGTITVRVKVTAAHPGSPPGGSRSPSGSPAVVKLPDPGSSGVRSVAFGDGGRTVAAADANGTTYLWDLATRKIIETLPDPATGGVKTVAFGPGGTLAAGDLNGKVYLWQLNPRKVIATLPDPHSKGVRGVAFGKHGTLIAGDENGTVYLWNLATRSVIRTFHDPGSDGVASVAISPDGSTLAAGDLNDTTFLWDLADGHAAGKLQDPGGGGIYSVAFSPSGTQLAAADGDGDAYVWDIATHKIAEDLPDPQSTGVYSVAFGKGGATVAMTDGNGDTYLWKLATRKIIQRLPEPPGNGDARVVFAPSWTSVAIGTNDDVYLWRP